MNSRIICDDILFDKNYFGYFFYGKLLLDSTIKLEKFAFKGGRFDLKKFTEI